ncbi:MAG: DUF1080 domain-containing protein [Saprospiraceae bacterium]|nr:DUF1080 domain-containing protein [Saprospiraceae bacterium]
MQKRLYFIRLVYLVVASLISQLSVAQTLEPKDPKATEDWSKPPVIIQGIKSNIDVPSDAIILLGQNKDQWTKKDGSPIEWTLENGVLTVKPGTGDIISKQSFEDCQLHLEWRSPLVVKGEGQGRGNSGVFFQSRYEVQILDNFNNETYYNGQAGAIYKQHPPLFNACSKTGDWNIYDIIYKAPVFDLFGNKTESARVTVIHNGIVIQNNTQIFGTTEYIGYPKNMVHGGAPFILQDHGDLVSFRNIWVRRL